MTGKRGRPKGSIKTVQQPIAPKNEASESRSTGGIQKTNTWLNVKGKAVYLNIPEGDVKLIDTEYGRKIVFITSLDSIKRLVSGEIQGVNLGTFEE